jgi:DNA repair exonuclease SbcCD ATPase subunit
MQTVVEERGMPMELYDAQFKRIDERLAEVDRRITETAKTTDLRLKEVDRRITEGNEQTARQFKELDRRITEGNEESNRRHKEVKGEVKETREAVKELGQQMHSLQTTFLRGHFALVASVVGAIFALLVKGG